MALSHDIGDWAKGRAIVKRRWLSLRRAATRWAVYSIRNVWIIQIVSSVLLVLGFGGFWLATGPHSLISSGGGTSGLLAVLAITNAIPIAAAASFLARFNANDRTTEGLATLAKLVAEQSSRLDSHPRENPSMRPANYRNLLSRPSSKNFTFSIPNEPQLLTPRPSWDGVWFYGNEEVPDDTEHLPQMFRLTHEVVYCAWTALKAVERMRRGRLALLFRSGRGGTQGSKWFLSELDKHRDLVAKPIAGKISDADGLRLVELALASWHYMSEELREYRDVSIRDEFREARFGAAYCSYLGWLNFFLQKAASSRYFYIAQAGRRRSDLDHRVSAYAKDTGSFKNSIDEVRSGFLARVAVAGRIHRVRQGAICPIILTATALICHLLLQPLPTNIAAGWGGLILAAGAYSLSSAAVLGNFMFAIWLLVPALSGD